MPLVVTVLLAWLATSAVVSPMVGMMLATCSREPAVGADVVAREEVLV